MYFDGSLKLEGAGAGVLLISLTGEQLKYVLQIFWKVSNNEAEYEALLHGPRLQASQYTTNLAFRVLGARHDWASSDCARRIQQSSGGHQQVHQVDQSQPGHLPQGRQIT
jgi:hypothetical protein